MQTKIFNMKVLFAGLVALGFGYGAGEAVSYSYLAKIFPLFVSLTFLLLACVHLGLEVVSFSRVKQEANVDDRGDSELKVSDVGKTEEDGHTRNIRMREVGIYGSLLYLGIWLVGYPLSIAIFIALFYRYVVKTDWILAAAAGLMGFNFILLISVILSLDWPAGIILLPWPLG